MRAEGRDCLPACLPGSIHSNTGIFLRPQPGPLQMSRPSPRCEHPAQLLLSTQAFSLQVDGGSVRTVVKPCSLDPATQKLITNIFSKDMFKNAMTLMNLGEEGL